MIRNRKLATLSYQLNSMQYFLISQNYSRVFKALS